MSTKKKMILGAVFYENFELLDMYGPLEMFGILNEIKIVTVAEKAGPVKSTQGPKTVADFSFDDCPPLDLILVPGGIGTLAELKNEQMLEFLRNRSQTARYTMSVCTGSALLAKAGLLDGRRATSNKLYFDMAVSQSDQVEWVAEARWVEDGPFVTASGVSAGTDMALGIVSNLFGRERADWAAMVSEYEWNDDASHDPFVKYLNKGSDLGG